MEDNEQSYMVQVLLKPERVVKKADSYHHSVEDMFYDAMYGCNVWVDTGFGHAVRPCSGSSIAPILFSEAVQGLIDAHTEAPNSVFRIARIITDNHLETVAKIIKDRDEEGDAWYQ